MERSTRALIALALLGTLGCGNTEEPQTGRRPLATPAASTTPGTATAGTAAVISATTETTAIEAAAHSATGSAPGADAPDPELVSQGEKLFKQIGCDACHRQDQATPVGADVRGIWGKTIEFEDGTTTVVDKAYIQESILDPRVKIVKGYQAVMPEYSATLEDRELAALVAYVQSLAMGPGGATPH